MDIRNPLRTNQVKEINFLMRKLTITDMDFTNYQIISATSRYRIVSMFQLILSEYIVILMRDMIRTRMN